MSILHPDRFYIGDIATFLKLAKLIKCDPECCIAFDFVAGRLEFESMVMAGIAAIGIRLARRVGGIVVQSPGTRDDRVVVRVDTGAFFQAAMGVSTIPYAYMSIGLAPGDASIQIMTFDQSNARLCEATICTLVKHDTDGPFPIVNGQAGGGSLEYAVTARHDGMTWRRYMQAATVDTTIQYRAASKQLVWGVRGQQTNISLFMPLPSTPDDAPDVNICLLPAIGALVRSMLQAVGKAPVDLSISDDLPVYLVATLDGAGSLVRLYAGTKED